jgi:hypothetical protein
MIVDEPAICSKDASESPNTLMTGSFTSFALSVVVSSVAAATLKTLFFIMIFPFNNFLFDNCYCNHKMLKRLLILITNIKTKTIL